MISPFLIDLNKITLTNDISLFVSDIEKNIQNGNVKKKNSNISWILINSLDILLTYDVDYKSINILEDNEYQNILNAIIKILNKDYYGFTK